MRRGHQEPSMAVGPHGRWNNACRLDGSIWAALLRRRSRRKVAQVELQAHTKAQRQEWARVLRDENAVCR
jgi:hypothetical protein